MGALALGGLALALLVLAPQTGDGEPGRESMKPTAPLSPEEARVIEHKGTERAFTGKYWDHHEDGTYRCRRCGQPLFASGTKFDSGSGWPSFDAALPGAVREVPDPDGLRTEIVCAHCGAHLGHVFRGEGFTAADTRHCVNSVSLAFEPAVAVTRPAPPPGQDEAFFAGGCFWGVEHHFEKVPGVISAVSGYMGGDLADPSYEQVCAGGTGHAEAVRVRFDPARVGYPALAKLFFEIHDPTQLNRQGPDVGKQYRSAVFVTGPEQEEVVRGLIQTLTRKGYRVQTQVLPAGPFYEAEAYHQDYYSRKGGQPYCHARVRRFDLPGPAEGGGR